MMNLKLKEADLKNVNRVVEAIFEISVLSINSHQLIV